MSIGKRTGDSSKDELLDWLDGHSSSVSGGLALPLMYKKWVEAKRDPKLLADSLQTLIDTDWIEITPASEPPHLRFTKEGYGRMLDATVTDASNVVASAAPPPVEVPPVPAARPAPKPEPVTRGEVPAFSADSGVPVWLAPDAAPTEIGLRNQILEVFRDSGIRTGGALNATKLSRYWQEMGQRAGNLRLGLDLAVRDGYLRPQRAGLDMFFALTDGGDAFVQGPLTPVALLRSAPAMGLLQAALTTEAELKAITALATLGQQGDRESFLYADLLGSFVLTGLDENDLLHGLDLLFKAGYLKIGAEKNAVLSLTDSGRAFGRKAHSSLLGDAAKRASRLE